MKPYFEIHIKDNLYIRSFSRKLTQLDLKWHIDLEDRYIYSPELTNWLVQLDNQLPVRIPNSFENMLYIPKYTWHRAIVPDVNKSDLTLCIQKSNI